MKEKKGLLLQTTRQINIGAGVSGLGFLLYLGVSALGWIDLADIIAIAFGTAAIYVFASASALREREKEAVSYSLLWGTGALALLLGGCALLGIRLHLGL